MQSPRAGEKGASILAALVVTALLGGGLAANLAVQSESQLALASKSAAQRAVEKAKRDKELKEEADKKCEDLKKELKSNKDLKVGYSKIAGDAEDNFVIGTPSDTRFKENIVSSRCVSAIVVEKNGDENVVKCFGTVYTIVLHKEAGDKKKKEPDKQSWRVRVKPSQRLNQGNCVKAVTDDKGNLLSKENLQAALSKDPEIQKQVIDAINETPKTALPAAQQDAFNAAVKELTDPDKANKAAESAQKAWDKAYQEWQDCLSKGTGDCSKLDEKNKAAEQAYNEKKATADYVAANKDYFNDAKKTLEGTARLGRSKEGGDNEETDPCPPGKENCTDAEKRYQRQIDEARAAAQRAGAVPPPSASPSGFPDNRSGQSTGFGQNSGGMRNIGSLLRGLGSMFNQPPPAPAQTCSTDPTIYAQQQQQYQLALQQYNYQLQQYNYQLQISQNNPNYSSYPVAPTMPQPCTAGTTASCPNPPAQPDPSGCQNGSWRPTYGGQNNACLTSWQCVPSGGGTGGTTAPTAQISCQPQVGDVGMSLAITFSCSAGVSTGTGFNTGGAQSGATTTTLTLPPGGANTVNYGLACSNNGQTGTAQCTVQVGKPAIVLVANPKSVSSGQTSAIGWVTSGMQVCVISSSNLPSFTSDNANKTNVNGTVTTPPLTSSNSTYNFLLHCTTIGGATRDATTTVAVTP